MGRSGRSSGRERSLGLELADCSPPRIRPPLEGWRVSRCCGQGSPGQAGGRGAAWSGWLRPWSRSSRVSVPGSWQSTGSESRGEKGPCGPRQEVSDSRVV